MKKTMVSVIFTFYLMIVLISSGLTSYSFAATGNDMVSITCKKEFDALYDNDSGMVFIIVKNLTDQPIQIDNIVITNPIEEYLTIYDDSEKKIDSEETTTFNNKIIEVNQSMMLTYQVKTGRRVPTGNSVVIVDIQFTQMYTDLKFNNILPVDVNTKVTASSDILTAFAIPSFLFLPGLIFTVIVLFAMKLNPKEFSFISTIQYKDPIFWVFSIAMSLLFIGIYSRYFGYSDLYKSYGLNDIVILWIWSMGAAVIFVGTAIAIRKRYFARRTFTEDSDEDETDEFKKTIRAIAAIKKTYRIHHTLMLKQITITNDTVQGVWLLLKEDNNDRFICRQISISEKENIREEHNTTVSPENEMNMTLRKLMDTKEIKDIELIRYLDQHKESIDFDWTGVKKYKKEDTKLHNNEYRLILYR
ncbi:MAG: hypothetical protein WBI07_09110 [Mobilitalea sp.]